MITVPHKLLKSILISSYLLVSILVIYAISSIYSYLNSGAETNNKVQHLAVNASNYVPKTVWDFSKSEGRLVDKETIKTLEKDYLQAWYVRHIAYKTNTTPVLKDYYTQETFATLAKNIHRNKTNKIHLNETTLTHNITLNFFSEDGKIAIITDTLKAYQHVFKNKKRSYKINETATYKAILLLEDNFWRIRHLVKKKTNPTIKKNPLVALPIFIKGINYYPQQTPWNMFGTSFNPDAIETDFKLLKKAQLNTVRIFVPYNLNQEETTLKQLYTTLDLAAQNNLKVIVTLFDFYGDYSILQWTLNLQYLEKVVTLLKAHPALLAWDIKNEPNLDFKSRGKELVLDWLEHMIYRVKELDEKHPVTIGWSTIESARYLNEKVDFVSFHYYEALEDLEAKYTKLKQDVPNKPIVLGEFGMSSNKGFWSPFGNSEKDQAKYYQKAQALCAKNKIPFISWTLYDFTTIPDKVVGTLPWRKNQQKHFGLITKEGKKKEAFKYISN